MRWHHGMAIETPVAAATGTRLLPKWKNAQSSGSPAITHPHPHPRRQMNKALLAPGVPSLRQHRSAHHRRNRRRRQTISPAPPSASTPERKSGKAPPTQTATAPGNTFCRYGPLPQRQSLQHPRRRKQQRQHLLRLIVQQNPSRQRGQRPQQHRRRPVLLNVEDLPHQRNRRAGGHRPHGVERASKAA